MKSKNIVACGHPRVGEAAKEILAAGGNAFDAAVAAGFASGVAEQALTGLGGGGFLLARTSEGEEILFDFFVNTPGLGRAADGLEPHFFPVTVHFPGSDQDFNVGLGSVAVPGNLKGFLHVQKRLGRLPLKQILAPAIRMAEQGVTINASQGYFFGLLKPIMTMTPAGRSLYMPGGRYPAEGDRLTNPEMALFLRTLARDDGYDAAPFYQGEPAAAMERDMRHGRGLLTARDLAAYRVVESRPLSVDYRGYRLLTNPPPSMGGSLIALGLSIQATWPAGPLTWGTGEQAVRTAAAMVEVDRRRDAATQFRFADGSEIAPPEFSRGTSHISVADSRGNVASLTMSNGEGSGYIVPGTGIMLNNMMGEEDLHPDGFHACPAGRRVASMMSPAILLHDDKPFLVLGSGGSKRIRTAITQVICNVIDYGLELEAAVTAPRIHWDGLVMQMEPGWPPEAVQALRQRWPVNEWPALDMYFGGVHAVMPEHAGAGDPRRGGSVSEV